MVRKEQQADMNRKTRITTTKRQQQPQGGGNMRRRVGETCALAMACPVAVSPWGWRAQKIRRRLHQLRGCLGHRRHCWPARDISAREAKPVQERQFNNQWNNAMYLCSLHARGSSPSRHRSWSQRLSGCDLLLHSYAKPPAPALHQRAHLTDGPRGGGQRLSARACRRPGVWR